MENIKTYAYTPHPDEHIDALVRSAVHNMQKLNDLFSQGLFPQSVPPLETSVPINQVLQQLCTEGSYVHAAPLAFQLAIFHPEKIEYVYQAAQIFQRLELFEVAAMWYACYIEQTKQTPSPTAHYGLGQCFVGLKKTDLALQQFEAAFELARGQEQWRVLQEYAEQAIDSLGVNTY